MSKTETRGKREVGPPREKCVKGESKKRGTNTWDGIPFERGKRNGQRE